jgi:uncharacterized protein YciI
VTQDESAPADFSRLLACDYWLIHSLPVEGTDAAAIGLHVQAHVAWLLELERSNVLFLSGPLLSGPGTGPGSGITVFRVPDEQTAQRLASEDPFVKAGLRTFTVHRWRLNEGSVNVRLSLGTGGYDWQ